MYWRNKYLCLVIVTLFSLSIFTPPASARGQRLQKVWEFLNKPVEECVQIAWQKARTDVQKTRQQLALLRGKVFRQGSRAFYSALAQKVMSQVEKSVDQVGADEFCRQVEKASGAKLPIEISESNNAAQKRGWILRTMQKRLAKLREPVCSMKPQALLGTIASAECAVDELEAGYEVSDVLRNLRTYSEKSSSSAISESSSEGESPVVRALASIVALMVLLAVIGGAIFVISQVGFGGVVAITFILFYFVYYMQM